MSSSDILNPPNPSRPPKVHSCVLCAQRKVKCDKNIPCSNCVKARVECVPSAPVRPRRRRRPLPQEDLLARLKRYETLLASFGVSKEDLESRDLRTTLSTKKLTPPSEQAPKDAGSSMYQDMTKYLQNHAWVNLSEEILEGSSDDDDQFEATPQPVTLDAYPQGENLILEGIASGSNLTDLHPPPVRIFQLWQTFIDNVNPLVKVIHAPTLQVQILDASANLKYLSPPLEALMFSIYAIAVCSMSHADCESMMDEPKAVVLDRYHAATQQALINARFLKSKDPVVLQAFLLFLLSMRHFYDHQTLWILTGVAIRMGQRLGINREATFEKMPVFEAEMLRRLCWQILLLEGRAADLASVGSSMLFQVWDTDMPRNVNDSDLYPGISKLPKDHVGTTEMMFCLMRYELGNFIRNSEAMAKYGGGWQVFTSSTVPVAEKDKLVDEIEEILERKYIRYFDLAIPLHLLATGVARGAFGRLRLMCHHPRQYPDRGASMAQSEKDRLFQTCLTMMEWDNRGHATKSIQRFLWHVNFNFQTDALVYLLSELRYQSTGEKTDLAWATILDVFKYHPEILIDTKNPLWVAIGNLTLKSWRVREREFARQNRIPPEGPSPNAITTFRFQRMKLVDSSSYSKPVASDYTSVPPLDNNRYYNGISDSSTPFEMTSPLDGDVSMDMSPIDWSYWNELIKGSELEVIPSDEDFYQQEWQHQ